MFAYAWFTRWITEFAITDRRVISKRGFIMRNTAEMNMDKVESVKVEQSVLGRLLDYGTVTVVGTGQGLEPHHRTLRRRSRSATRSPRNSNQGSWLSAQVLPRRPARRAAPSARGCRRSGRARCSKLVSIGPSSTRPRGSFTRSGSTKRPLTRIS